MRGLRLSLPLLALIAVVLAGPSAVLAFSGDLFSNTVPPGIVGTGFWVTTGPTHLSWSVSQELSGIWDYSYTFTVPDGNISHLILEVSPTFTANDLFGLSGTFTSTTIGTFSPSDPGNSNPNLPGTIHGIKFDGVNATTGIFSFKSFRDPVWGDFYSKNGTAHNDQGVFNTAWNAGFTLADPTNPPANGTITNHLLVPDSTVPVPDASTVVLASVGILPLLGMRRRRR